MSDPPDIQVIPDLAWPLSREWPLQHGTPLSSYDFPYVSTLGTDCVLPLHVLGRLLHLLRRVALPEESRCFDAVYLVSHGEPRIQPPPRRPSGDVVNVNAIRRDRG